MNTQIETDILIREATVEDAPAIAALSHALTEKFVVHDFTPAARQALLASLDAERVAGYFEAGYRYHVAVENGRIVGVAGMRDNRHLYHLFVAESHQRRGVARRLWHISRAMCVAAGNRDAVTVNAARHAEPIYLKLGFVADGPRQERNGVSYVPMKFTLDGAR